MTTSLCFNDFTFSPVTRGNQPWFKSSELARALGYKREDILSKLYRKNADEFTSDMTQVIENIAEHRNGVHGNLSDGRVRIFSLRGCHLLAMFARTPVAKAFRRWVLDVIEQYGDRVPVDHPITLNATRPSRRSDPERKALTAIINTWVGIAPIHYASARAQVNAHFGVASVDALTIGQVKEAIQWVQSKIDELSRKPLEEKVKALPPAQRNLPAPAPYLDETPFLKFVEEIQSAHEEVRNILQPLMSNSFNLCLELGLELGKRSGMRSGSIKGMDPTRNLTDLLQHSIFSDLRQALIYPERHLADYANPGYALLGIVRQLNAR